jgi:hypothetical protein
MHPNVSIILIAAILWVKDALERRTSVAKAIVRLPARIDVSHQKLNIQGSIHTGSQIIPNLKGINPIICIGIYFFKIFDLPTPACRHCNTMK